MYTHTHMNTIICTYKLTFGQSRISSSTTQWIPNDNVSREGKGRGSRGVKKRGREREMKRTVKKQ